MILKVVTPYSSGQCYADIPRQLLHKKGKHTHYDKNLMKAALIFPLFIDTDFYIYVFTKYFSEGNASYAYAKKYVAYS